MKVGFGILVFVFGMMGIGVLNVIMCIIVMILIDWIGWKKLLMWGSVGIILSLVLLLVIFFFVGLLVLIVWLIVLFFGIYIVFY